ncbi:MAG: PAS domain S-box protein [Blastocatellia bacterium]|nr:PAS domain S-box protein [Blastocatellia bacterium]
MMTYGESNKGFFKPLGSFSDDYLILAIDKQLVCNYASQSVEQFTDLSASSCIGKSLLELELCQEVSEVVQKGTKEVISTKRVLELEFSTNIDGAKHYLQAKFFPQFNCDTVFEGIIIIISDITLNSLNVLKEASNLYSKDYEQILTSVSEFMWITDAEGNSLNCSVNWTKITGQTAQEVTGWGWLDAVHPDDRHIIVEAWKDAAINREDFSVEYRLRTSGDKYRRFVVRGYPVCQGNDQVSKWIGLGRDITEEVKVKNLLQEKLSILDQAHEIASIGSWSYDPFNSQNMFWSKQACSIFGFDNEPFESTIDVWWSMVHPDDLLSVRASIDANISENSESSVTFRIFSKRGLRWIFTKSRLVEDEQWQSVRLLGIFQDVTEAKLREERMQQQAALLDIVQDAIIVCDLDEIVLSWNKQAAKMYGWSQEEAIGSPLSKLTGQESSEFWQEGRQKVIQDGLWQSEFIHSNKLGVELLVESRWTLMLDSMIPKSILIANTDVTEKRRLESQILRAQRMESIGILASGIAHDLNNVLSPILMSVQLLKRKLQDSTNQKMLSTVEMAVHRGADLIRQILSFSRGMETGLALVNIDSLIAEIRNFVTETFPKSIEVTTEVGKYTWGVVGDLTQLHQVLLNLCVNARDAMPFGGKLRLAVENEILEVVQPKFGATPGRYVVIKVEDTGCGIAPTTINKIFDPFFTTKDFGKGTGLGLSTVMAIVKGHRGFVDVSSQMGQGTCFKIYLPATDTNVQSSTKSVDTEAPSGVGETILVIDDEPAIRELTKACLEGRNYRVITANDGTDGLSLYLQNRDSVDLVITDMMMPFMDGISTVRALRKIDPTVKVIGITGLTLKGREQDLMSLGVKTLLVKPYTFESLLKAIHQEIHAT